MVLRNQNQPECAGQLSIRVQTLCRCCMAVAECYAAILMNYPK